MSLPDNEKFNLDDVLDEKAGVNQYQDISLQANLGELRES